MPIPNVFALIHVMSYAYKITSMQYLCGTVAIIPGSLRAIVESYSLTHIDRLYEANKL